MSVGAATPIIERRTALQAFSRALARESHNLTACDLEAVPQFVFQQLHNRLQWADGLVQQLTRAEAIKRAADGQGPLWFHARTPFREAEALLRTLRHVGVQACAFSHGGKTLCGVGDSVRLWDASSGAELGNARGPKEVAVSCAFDRSGDYLLIGSRGGVVWVRDASTLAVLAEVHVEGDEAHCATSPVEPVGLIASGVSLRLIELPSGRELATSTAEDGVFSCCTLSVGDLIVTGDDAGTLGLWSWSPIGIERQRRVVHAHQGPVRGCAVSPDYAFLATAGDDAVKIWGFDEDGEIRVSTFRQFGLVNDCAISPDSQLLASASDDRTTWVRTVRDLKAPVSVLEGHGAAVLGCAFPAVGPSLLATAGRDDTVRIWDPTAPRSLGGTAGHRDRVTAVAFAPDGSFVVSASADMTLRVWEPAPTAERHSFEGHLGPVWDCVVLDGGSLFASASGDGDIRLWDVASGQATRVLHVGNDVHALAYSPDGHLLAAGHGDWISLWEIASGQRIKEADVGGGLRAEWVEDSAFTPDGRLLLLACADGTLRLWDVAGWRELAVLRGHTDLVSSCAVDPAGAFALSGSRDGTVRLWDLPSGTQAHVFAGHASAVWDCDVSADGVIAVSAGWDETLRLWHVASRTPMAILSAPEALRSVAMHPSELRIACGGAHGWLRVIDLVGGIKGPPWPAERGLTSAVI